MTVCIAAISDEGSKAILIADKMLTSVGGLLPYQNDGVGDKIFKISERVHGLWCGGLTDVMSILDEFKRSHADPSEMTVQEVAYALREAHFTYLMRVLERENIIGRGIPSLADFYGNQSINLTTDVRQQIQSVLATASLNSNPQFIICGKDDMAPYKIFTLNANPRFPIMAATDGYAQIGSGAFHAQFSIIHSDYNPRLAQEDVKIIAKEAKRKAEKAPDVGTETDVVLLAE